MKVYPVWASDDESSQLIAVCASLELAEEIAKEFPFGASILEMKESGQLPAFNAWLKEHPIPEAEPPYTWDDVVFHVAEPMDVIAHINEQE